MDFETNFKKLHLKLEKETKMEMDRNMAGTKRIVMIPQFADSKIDVIPLDMALQASIEMTIVPL